MKKIDTKKSSSIRFQQEEDLFLVYFSVKLS